jgi:hypothetical protein
MTKVMDVFLFIKNTINLHHIYQKYDIMRLGKDIFIKYLLEQLEKVKIVFDALKNIYE